MTELSGLRHRQRHIPTTQPTFRALLNHSGILSKSHRVQRIKRIKIKQ